MKRELLIGILTLLITVAVLGVYAIAIADAAESDLKDPFRKPKVQRFAPGYGLRLPPEVKGRVVGVVAPDGDPECVALIWVACHGDQVAVCLDAEGTLTKVSGSCR